MARLSFRLAMEPVCRQSQVEEEKPSKNNEQLNRAGETENMKKILAINDQQNNLTSLKAVISTYIPNCTFLPALSGKEGIKLAILEQPDTILLDIVMPEMDGYEVCRRLKEDETTKYIPIVMIGAAETDTASRIKGLDTGADLFLAKDIDPVELAANVKVMFRIKESEDRLRVDKALLERTVHEKTAELIDSEKKYKALYDNAPLSYQSLDKEGKFIDVNPAWLNALGYEKDEVIGKYYTDFLHPDWKPHFEKNFPAFKKRGYVNDVQFKVKHKTGRYLDINFEGCIGYHPDGSFKQTYCVFQDITERKQSEDKLRESELRFKELVEMLPEAVFETDLNFKLTYVNKRALEITGYSELDFSKGIDGMGLLAPEDQERAKEHFKIRFAGKEPGTIEYNAQKKDGTIFPILFHASSIITGGKLSGLRGIIVDLSEQKKSENILKLSEEKFRKAFLTSPDSININRLEDGMYISINNGFTQIMGYSENEVLGKTSLEINIWNNLEDRQKFVSGLKKKGIVENLEAKFCSKNGTLKDGLMSASIIELDGVCHILSITRDITVRKQVEQELKRSEDKFKALMHQSPFVVEIYDINGLQVSVNKAYETLWGFPAETTLHKFNLLESEEVEKAGLLEYVKKAYAGEAMTVPDYKFDPTGQTESNGFGRNRWLATKIFPLKDSSYNVINIVITHEDITDRKRANEIQHILFNITNAVSTTSSLEKLIELTQKELGQVIDTNNFYVAFYDEDTDMLSLPYMADEKESAETFPAGKSLTGYVIRSQQSLLINSSQQEKLVREGKLEFVGPRNKVWLGVPLRSGDKVTGVMAVQSYTNEDAYNKADVEILEFLAVQISLTIQRKKAETALKAALKKATESDRIKSAFLATMSHELRTPLNAIIGFSSLINHDMSIDEIIDFNSMINFSGINLLNIIEDIFDISLVESGGSKINNEDIRVNSLLKEIDEIIGRQLQDSNKDHLELVVDIPPLDHELIINSDRVKLKQIIINLLKNAIKFTETGYIKYGYSIENYRDGSVIVFYVEDTGIGIPIEIQEIIFDTFRQADESATRTYGGTGIGLSIAYSLTALLGGRLWLESEEGDGSTFYFTIPYTDKNKVDANTKQLESSIEEEPFTGIKGSIILIVEDDETNYQYLDILLKMKDAVTIRAVNGEIAIKYCQEDPSINLVLMDLDMPIMNGYIATAEIKKFKPSLPIIAQTAYAIAGDKEKAIAAGCDDYIAKPIKKEILLEKIEYFLSTK